MIVITLFEGNLAEHINCENLSPCHHNDSMLRICPKDFMTQTHAKKFLHKNIHYSSANNSKRLETRYSIKRRG